MLTSTDSSTKHTANKLPLDGATSFKAKLLQHGDKQLLATTMRDNQDIATTQHCGQGKPLTKCGPCMFWTIWICHNGELYGKDYEEQWSIAFWTTHDRVQAIYERTKFSNNPKLRNHTALTTNHRSLEVDETPPRCIPSNSQSVTGTKHWPRLTLQDSLGCN
jgi:hypothetical protein